MKKINHIQDIYSFGLTSKALFFVDLPIREFKACDLEGTPINSYKSDKRLSPVSCSSEGLCWVDNFDNSQSILYLNNEFIEKKIIISKVFKNDAFTNTLICPDSRIRLMTKLNLTTSKEYWTFKPGFEPMLITDKYCIKGTTNGITALNNQTGEELWTYTLPKEFDYLLFSDLIEANISHILGLYNDIIWLALNSGALVGVNSHTGKFVKHITSPDFYSDDCSLDKEGLDKGNGATFHTTPQLDTEKGIIFSCIRNMYSEIDLNQESFPYTVWDITKELDIQDSFSNTYPFRVSKIGGVADDTIYIYDDSDSQCFGAFDQNTKKILWSEIFQGENEGWGAIHNLKYASGHLYIHAKVDKSLHIYKLEK
ncbi:MAG: hypothetical protein V3U87_13935 [Methylococcaceae bacterium]